MNQKTLRRVEYSEVKGFDFHSGGNSVSHFSIIQRSGLRRKALSVASASALVGSVAFVATSMGNSLASADPLGSPQGQLSSLSDTNVGSLSAPNGDNNPYGIAVVPLTSGNLTAGNILVADFSNAAGTAGAGTTIMQINPTTGVSSVFYQGTASSGPVGIAINPVNDGVWIGDYGSMADGSAANDLLINAKGVLVATFNNTTTAGAAAFNGVWGQAVSKANGAVSFYWGNAGNATTGTGGGDVWRLTPHPGGTSNGQPVNSTYAQIAAGQSATPAGGSAANAVGPQGMAFDASTGVLYETNDASNTLYAIANAATASDPVPPTVVYQGGALVNPQNVVIDPQNGNLLVVNGGNNKIVEITPAGHVVATRNLAPDQPVGALFGLATSTDAAGNLVLYYVNDNENSLHSLSFASSNAPQDVQTHDGGTSLNSAN